MKPITNLLLVIALICYAFMPLYNVALQGSVSGLAFTADKIGQLENVLSVVLGIIPFAAGFGAIAVNCLRHRRWGYLVAALILLVAAAMYQMSDMQAVGLTHNPELAPDSIVGEGFQITSLGWGFYSCLTFLALALVSTLISILPLEFNIKLEQSIDQRFEESKKHIAGLGDDLQKRLENYRKRGGKMPPPIK